MTVREVRTDAKYPIPLVFKMSIWEKLEIKSKVLEHLGLRLRPLRIRISPNDFDRIYKHAIDLVERGCYDLLMDYVEGTAKEIVESFNGKHPGNK